jgi:Fe-S cluster assembly protein SufD
MDSVNAFEKALQSFKTHYADSPEWVREFRKSAEQTFVQNGLPTTQDESWKYTNLRSLRQGIFEWKASSEATISEFAKRFFLPDSCRAVFKEGNLVYTEAIPKGVIFCSLKEAFEKYADKVKEVLQTLASVHQNALTHLNEAFLAEGCFLYIPSGVKFSKILHFINLNTQGSQTLASFPRKLIYLESEAELALIESVVTAVEEDSADASFINSISDIVLNRNAQCSYAKIQRGLTKNIYISHTRYFQKEGSKSYSFFDLAHTPLSREGVCVKLVGERAEARVRGVFHTQDQELVDYNVSMDHAASYTKSRQLFKGVAEDRSRGVFNAHIRVREGLRKIDAHQVTKNLLLGSEAEIDARPHLEIDSDDVKCAHGAAVGRLRPDEIFYLQSRGMTREKAEKILSVAFTEEVLLDIQDEVFRNQILHLSHNLSETLKLSISEEGGSAS